MVGAVAVQTVNWPQSYINVVTGSLSTSQDTMYHVPYTLCGCNGTTYTAPQKTRSRLYTPPPLSALGRVETKRKLPRHPQPALRRRMRNLHIQ